MYFLAHFAVLIDSFAITMKADDILLASPAPNVVFFSFIVLQQFHHAGLVR